ncbi:YbfB/YjiJ family MFS transporter [Methylobacterium sp. DB0501]|nr:YbfB/YjiJ family MFS transporter [Methylobacterium sp. DB0501]
MGIGRFSYTPILPAMAADLALTQAQAGLLASANLLGYLVGALAAALPALRGSPRLWFLASLAASAVSTILMAAAGDVATFLLLRFVGGVASAFVLVFASSVILDRLAAMGRPTLSCLHFAGIGAGIVLSALLVNAAGALGADWRGDWLVVGLTALVATPVVGVLVPPDARSSAPAAERGALRLGRPLVALLAAYFLFGLGYVTTATFLVTIIRGMPDLRSAESAIWLVVGLSAMPSVALWTGLSRRIGVVPTLSLAFVAEAAGVVGSVVSGSVGGAVVAAALLGGTFVPITALGIMAARSLAGTRRRQVVALMTSSFGLGSIIAPTIAGAIADLTSSFALPSFLAAGALTLAALLSLAAEPRRSCGDRILPQASGA